MKKTTTRLATVAAVLTMSAFAIILAQVDARKRDRSTEAQPLIYSGEADASPLQINAAWPDQKQVVRATQEELKEQLIAVSWRDESDFEEESSFEEEPRQVVTVGETQAVGPEDEDSLWRSLDDLGDSVVAVSGESTSPPGWLTDDSSMPSQLPAMPSVGLPTTSLSDQESTDANLSDFDSSEFSDFNSPDAGPPQAYELPSNPLPSNPLPSNPLPTTLPPAALPPADVPPAAVPPTSLPEASFPSTSGANNNLPDPTGSDASWSQLNQSGNDLRRSEEGMTQNAVEKFQGQDRASTQIPNSFSSEAMPGMPVASPSASPRAALVSNQPGSRFLDGSQNPIMQIQKRAPEEIQVGKQATFVITVRNAGSATAHDVTVVDRVPRGSRFAEALPAVTPTGEGVLVWNLGEMAAGDERTINLQIIPEVEGEVGSVASVHFAAQASVRTVATLPQLALHVESMGSAIIGQAQPIVVTIENTGSGVARAVRLEADIPEQLRHESGEAQLEALVGDLRPGESRRLTLNVAAVQAGQSQCLFRALNDDGIQSERTTSVDVRAPQLAASISGPSLRYLDRQANYKVAVSNTGTAMARNLDFVVHLPVGLKFVSVDIPQANYNPQSHSISLGLAELDAGQSAPFSITVLPVQPGSQVIRFNANADLGAAAEAKTQVTVAGLAELAFTIGQDNGIVEIGASTTYSVQITNVGNQPDKNVTLQVQLPEGSKLLNVDSPVDHRIEGQRVLFEPIAEMRSRDAQTIRLQVQHSRAGSQVIRSQLTSENRPAAVVKEESTLVYDDQN